MPPHQSSGRLPGRLRHDEIVNPTQIMNPRQKLSFIFYIPLVLLIGCSSPPPDMTLIPSGDFLMGTDERDTEEEAIEFGLPHPWYEDEHPLRKVYLPSFYIDQYEVTYSQYQKFLQATGHPAPEDWIHGAYAPEKTNFPVVFVNWYEANDYCRWADKRLPTEPEWEKAARGTHGQEYPWGNVFNPDFANVAKGSVMLASSVAVGRYEAGKSPYGVYDMIGNVWEWTDSWYEPYPGNTSNNESFGRILRVIRGLSFLSVGHYPSDAYLRVLSIVARASFRSYDLPTTGLVDLGFRCAKSAK